MKLVTESWGFFFPPLPTHKHTHARTHPHIHMHAHTRKLTHTNTCMHTHTCMHTYICTHVSLVFVQPKTALSQGFVWL